MKINILFPAARPKYSKFTNYGTLSSVLISPEVMHKIHLEVRFQGPQKKKKDSGWKKSLKVGTTLISVATLFCLKLHAA